MHVDVHLSYGSTMHVDVHVGNGSNMHANECNNMKRIVSECNSDKAILPVLRHREVSTQSLEK